MLMELLAESFLDQLIFMFCHTIILLYRGLVHPLGRTRLFSFKRPHFP